MTTTRTRVLLLFPGDIDRQPHRPPAPVARGGHPLPPPATPPGVCQFLYLSRSSVPPAPLRAGGGGGASARFCPLYVRFCQVGREADLDLDLEI